MTVVTEHEAVETVSARDNAAEEYAKYFVGHGPTTEQVWREVSKAWSLTLGFTTREGKPRSACMIYATSGRRLFVEVHPGSLKAREIHDGDEVAVTVPVRRGGLLALVMPIPPAAISFHARVIAHPLGTVDLGTISKLFAGLPEDVRKGSIVFELVPEGQFLTFGVGISLMEMRDLNKALGRAPVA